jgi:cytochrome b561
MNTNNQILVWDLSVRVFHWSLVLFFIVAYATGDDKNSPHRYVGYAVLGLVAARIFGGLRSQACGIMKPLSDQCLPGKMPSMLPGEQGYASGVLCK